MMEKANQITSVEAPQLSIGNKLRKGVALASTVIAMAGTYIGAKEVISPDKADAALECTTTTTTTEENGSVTTTQSTECTDVPTDDSTPEATPTSPTPEPKQPKPDKPTSKPNKDKKDHAEDTKTKKANSQKGFAGYNMEDSSFTDGNGCFITAAASSLRRETGNKHITPRSIYYPAVRSRWTPGAGVHGFLFDALPSMASRHQVKVYDTGFKGALKAKKNGDEVMVLAAPGHFTSQGHYMAVRGVTKNGKKLILDDPNGRGRYGDSERKSGWNGRQLKAGGVIDYRVLHLKGVK